MSTLSGKKVVAVIGGTGAQGRAVVRALLSGINSPFNVRILTRNAGHPLAQELAALPGAEIIEGAVQDAQALARTFEGAYGAFVNTDSFAIGEETEFHTGVRTYEVARRVGVKHFVWSSLEYTLKENGYDERYDAPHYSAKGRVWEFIKSQAAQDAGGMACTALVTGPYLESLSTLYAPIGQRASDGAFVFANPWSEDERFPFVALRDIGFFARWIFDNPDQTE
ncbi:NAD(P)-binding protein [Auricularia subglabra TFB-10046 SS5]|nr:NAD(P)-binding protein [Auricularia subglabra TFB-10046 SS5]